MYRHVSTLLLAFLMVLPLVACTGTQTPVVTPTWSQSSPPATGAPTVGPGPTREPSPTSEPAPSAVPSSSARTPTHHAAAPTATALSPTPTPIRASDVERILFTPGATQATAEGHLPANGSKFYVMRVAKGQYVAVDATVGTIGQGLRFSIVGADGVVVKPMGDGHVQAVVPSTQDYYLELMSDVGTVNYRMSVLIPARVRFAPGATSAEVAGSLGANDVRHYVLHARAGQRMIVDPNTSRGQVRLIISGVDGQVLLSGRVGPPGGTFDGILPTTQDYLITVWAEGPTGADYALRVSIPPE